MGRGIWAAGIAILVLTGCSPHPVGQEVWTLDNLRRIGDRPATVAGHPRLIRDGGHAAIAFDGAHDSILLKGRPLIGPDQFTIEMLMRPDGGDFEQKILHISETDPETGLDVRPVGTDHDANKRIMFELRTKDGKFYIDVVINSKGGKYVLAADKAWHPTGRWYAVAQTFDGQTYRAYVDGVLEAEMPALSSTVGSEAWNSRDLKSRPH